MTILCRCDYDNCCRRKEQASSFLCFSSFNPLNLLLNEPFCSPEHSKVQWAGYTCHVLYSSSKEKSTACDETTRLFSDDSIMGSLPGGKDKTQREDFCKIPKIINGTVSRGACYLRWDNHRWSVGETTCCWWCYGYKPKQIKEDKTCLICTHSQARDMDEPFPYRFCLSIRLHDQQILR